MLTKEGWEDFETTQGWREIVATVKERMRIINIDLLSPKVCNSEEKRIQYQTEYATCLYFLNITKLDSIKEERREEEDEAQKDRTISPDLGPFKL